jgi:hypothetical protein
MSSSSRCLSRARGYIHRILRINSNVVCGKDLELIRILRINPTDFARQTGSRMHAIEFIRRMRINMRINLNYYYITSYELIRRIKGPFPRARAQGREHHTPF